MEEIELSVLIGIPMLNESKMITEIITKAKQFGAVVAIDDGSTDNSFKLAQEAGATIISHNTNLGYGKSISDLFCYAREHNFDYLLTLDGDGQHNVDEIPNFLKALQSSDLVIGNRFLGNSNTPNYRKLGIKAISKLNGVQDSQCGFRCYNKRAINIIADNLYEKGMGISIEILKVAQSRNLKIVEIPCVINYNGEKHSQNPISHGFDLILAFCWWATWKNPSRTLLPLGLAFLLGTAISGIQLLNLYSKYHEIIQTWALLSVTLLLLTFIIFNMLVFILVFKNRKVTE